MGILYLAVLAIPDVNISLIVILCVQSLQNIYLKLNIRASSTNFRTMNKLFYWIAILTGSQTIEALLNKFCFGRRLLESLPEASFSQIKNMVVISFSCKGIIRKKFVS